MENSKSDIVLEKSKTTLVKNVPRCQRIRLSR